MSDLAKVAAAFIKVQEDLKNPPKSAFNPISKSRYAELSDILTFVRPILAKQGLAILQNVGSTVKGKPFVKTILLHESGESLETNELCLDPDGNKRMNGLQEMGSAVTYGKRYQICAFLGIAPEEDTDGNTKTNSKQSEQSKNESEGKPGKPNSSKKPTNKPGKPNNKPGNKPSNTPKPKVTESELDDGTKIQEQKGSNPSRKPVAEPVKDPEDTNKLLAKLQKEQPKLYMPLKKKVKSIKNRNTINESHIKQYCEELLGEGAFTLDDVAIVKETLDI